MNNNYYIHHQFSLFQLVVKFLSIYAHFTVYRDGKADKMQRQIVWNKDGKIPWNLTESTRNQCI